jgi:hypothetical protein
MLKPFMHDGSLKKTLNADELSILRLNMCLDAGSEFDQYTPGENETQTACSLISFNGL